MPRKAAKNVSVAPIVKAAQVNAVVAVAAVVQRTTSKTNKTKTWRPTVPRFPFFVKQLKIFYACFVDKVRFGGIIIYRYM